jgi:hypothetical protein
MKKHNPCHFSLLENAIDPFVILIRKTLSESFFFESENWIAKLGNLSAVISAFLFLTLGVRAAIKEDSFNAFMIGIAAFLLTLLVQYISIKFVEPTISSILNIQTSVSDSSILDIISLLFFLSGLGALVTGAYFAIKLDEFNDFLIGICMFFSASFAASLYINPNLVNIVIIESQGPAEDAIGVFSSFMKVSTRLCVIAYGIMVFGGTYIILDETIDIVKNQGFIEPWMLLLLIVGLIYPIVSYFTFILSMLSVQITNSILKLTPQLKAIAVILKNSKHNPN